RKEWSQRLSRNLALLAATERRQGREDPIGVYACFQKGADRQTCKRRGCPSCVCESVRAFDRADRVLFESDANLSREDVRDMLHYLARNAMGDGRKSRQRVLLALCRHAARIRAPREFSAALTQAMRIHPLRAIHWLVTSFPHTESHA